MGGFQTIFLSALREGKQHFRFDSYGHPQQKALRGQEILGISCLKLFLVKGKHLGRGAWGGGRTQYSVQPPPPNLRGLK